MMGENGGNPMVDPELMRRVRAGEYVVDPYAVAGAMLRAGALRTAAPAGGSVLESAEPDDLAARPDEPQPGSGLDPA
jgi:hypothetical protein